jgi:hypothetical protein
MAERCGPKRCLITSFSRALPGNRGVAQADNKTTTSEFVGPNGGTAYLMHFDSIDSANGSIANGGGFVGSSHYIAFECKK